MKTLKEQRDSIYNKIQEIESMILDDNKIFNEDDSYNFDELNKYLESSKKKNYAKAACMRMIKKFMDELYDGWTFQDKSYFVYVSEFKKFGW